MGGQGSGWNATPKTTVESCLTLNINHLMRQGFASTTGNRFGTVTWKSNDIEGYSPTLEYWVDSWSEEEISLRLNFTVRLDNEKREVTQHIILRSTTPNYGGSRWFFICQLARNGWTCSRRMVTLHLPPRQILFGCRSCYDLTYSSCQDSHKFDIFYTNLAKKAGLTFKKVKKIMMERF